MVVPIEEETPVETEVVVPIEEETPVETEVVVPIEEETVPETTEEDVPPSKSLPNSSKD